MTDQLDGVKNVECGKWQLENHWNSVVVLNDWTSVILNVQSGPDKIAQRVTAKMSVMFFEAQCRNNFYIKWIVTGVLAPATYCPSDIIFVVDSSGSVGSSNFALVKSFLSEIVSRLDIDRGTTHVGLVTYSTYARTRFYLSSYTSVASVQSAISRLTYPGGITNTAAALAHVRASMLISWRGDRRNVPNVVVVLTDGRSTNSSATRVRTMFR